MRHGLSASLDRFLSEVGRGNFHAPAPSTAPTRDESYPIKHGSRQSYGSVHTRSHGILWTWVGEKSQNEKKRSLRKRKREVAAVLRRLHRAQSQRLLLGDFEPRLRLLIPAAWAAGIPSV